MDIDFSGVLVQMGVLFVILALGFICKRVHITNDAVDKGLSGIVIKVTMPMLIVSSVVNASVLPNTEELLRCFLYCCIVQLLLFALAAAFTKILRVPRGEKGVFCFMIAFANVGFLGIPVVAALFGGDAVIYVAIVNLPFNIMAFTLGVRLITSDNSESPCPKFSVKTLFTPGILASVIAIVFAFLHIQHIPFVGEALSMLGSFSTPGALLVIGSQLGNLTARDMLGTPKIWALCVGRLLLCPLVAYAVMSHFSVSPVVLGVLSVCAAMPAANLASMFCLQYGGNGKLASQGILLSTAASFVTIPIGVVLISFI